MYLNGNWKAPGHTNIRLSGEQNIHLGTRYPTYFDSSPDLNRFYFERLIYHNNTLIFLIYKPYTSWNRMVSISEANSIISR
jgi:hypothetical protein